ncbi:MAG: calcium/sodium antiporter [Candidatus Omnitrophica bacterium]|nr:calcium/sodium antiporter [Candidatus Omnitrophota bacterium]
MANMVILIAGFALLIKSADFLVSGASALAKRIGVSDLVIGLTVVAFGTSTPELFVNLFASMQGNTEIAIGNVIGSNIFNIMLILGVASLIYPLSVSKSTVWKEIPFSLLAVLVLGALANDALFDKLGYSTLTRIDGFVFLAFFGIFMYYIASIAKDPGNTQTSTGGKIGLAKSLAMVIGGFIGLAFGGKLVVEGAVNIASGLGVSQSLIGLTIVAAGTSLPELATSAVAAYRKNADIAVGNIVGSNIFNIFFILGISSLIKPLPIVSGANIDILVLIGVSLLLFFSMFTGKRKIIDRWEGVVFIALYSVYVIYIIKRG